MLGKIIGKAALIPPKIVYGICGMSQEEADAVLEKQGIKKAASIAGFAAGIMCGDASDVAEEVVDRLTD